MAITRLVTNSLYLNTMPVAVVVTVVLGNLWVKKPRLLLIIVAATAAVGVLAVVVGYWGSTLPMRQLAGNISVE